MKNNISLLVALLLLTHVSFAQIPVEKYRKEIANLNSEYQIAQYWAELHRIDQEILVNTTDLKTADSISISNMVRTILLFDKHDTKGYNPNGFSGFLPIINLSHNNIAQSQIAYWPVIERVAEIGGAIQSFGGKYPAYQLESVSLTFYNYSLFRQEPKYPKLMEKLSSIKTENIIDELLLSLKHQNELRKLKEVAVLSEWFLKSSEKHVDERRFSFVKMSDGNVYKKSFGRIQKLELIETNQTSTIYSIENEPFDWNYLYGKDGSLTLIDDEKNVLIKYTQAD